MNARGPKAMSLARLGPWSDGIGTTRSRNPVQRIEPLTLQAAPVMVPSLPFDVLSAAVDPDSSSNGQYPARPVSVPTSSAPLLSSISVAVLMSLQRRTSSMYPSQVRTRVESLPMMRSPPTSVVLVPIGATIVLEATATPSTEKIGTFPTASAL